MITMSSANSYLQTRDVNMFFLINTKRILVTCIPLVFYDNRRVYSYKKIFGLAVIKNYGCVLPKVRRGSVLNRTDHAKFGVILSISESINFIQEMYLR